MRFTGLPLMAFASLAAAVAEPGFAIAGGTSILFTVSDVAKYDQVTKDILQAYSSYDASVTAQPEWSSAFSQLVEFQKTHKGVPSGVTDLNTIIEYETTPSWYSAMPTGLQNYLQKEDKARQEFLEDAVEKAIKGDAGRLFGVGIYIHGTIVALIAGLAIAL